MQSGEWWAKYPSLRLPIQPGFEEATTEMSATFEGSVRWWKSLLYLVGDYYEGAVRCEQYYPEERVYAAQMMDNSSVWLRQCHKALAELKDSDRERFHSVRRKMYAERHGTNWCLDWYLRWVGITPWGTDLPEDILRESVIPRPNE
jgi:hypothetical protein